MTEAEALMALVEELYAGDPADIAALLIVGRIERELER